jgi:hypothetical protein
MCAYIQVNAPDGQVPHFTNGLDTNQLINGTFAFTAEQSGEFSFCFHPQLATG